MYIQDFGLRRAHILYGEISVYQLGSPCSHCDATWVRPTFGGVMDKGYVFLGHEGECPFYGSPEVGEPHQEFVAYPRSLSPTYVRPARVFGRRSV